MAYLHKPREQLTMAQRLGLISGIGLSTLGVTIGRGRHSLEFPGKNPGSQYHVDGSGALSNQFCASSASSGGANAGASH